MKKHTKVLIFIVALIISVLTSNPSQLFSQTNYLYLGNNKYPCSDYIAFESKKNIQIRFAIKDQGGFIEFSSDECEIKGEIYIFLEDGDFIKCHDYGFRDRINNKEFSIYKLTENELFHLTEINIDKIRYGCDNYDYYAFPYLFRTSSGELSNSKQSSEYIYQENGRSVKSFPPVRIEPITETIKTLYREYRFGGKKNDFNALFDKGSDTDIDKNYSDQGKGKQDSIHKADSIEKAFSMLIKSSIKKESYKISKISKLYLADNQDTYIFSRDNIIYPPDCWIEIYSLDERNGTAVIIYWNKELNSVLKLSVDDTANLLTEKSLKTSYMCTTLDDKDYLYRIIKTQNKEDISFEFMFDFNNKRKAFMQNFIMMQDDVNINK